MINNTAQLGTIGMGLWIIYLVIEIKKNARPALRWVVTLLIEIKRYLNEWKR
jgi:hypothetical protein